MTKNEHLTQHATELPVLSAVAIFVSATKGEPMQIRNEVNALTGLGLEGDRYASRTGAFSGTHRIPDEDRQISLISRQAIDDANAHLLAEGQQPFADNETRRNIVVDYPSEALNALVGQIFFVGAVQIEGVELCTPCRRPTNLAKKPGFEQAFENRGGLRARILSDGVIKTKSATLTE